MWHLKLEILVANPPPSGTVGCLDPADVITEPFKVEKDLQEHWVQLALPSPLLNYVPKCHISSRDGDSTASPDSLFLPSCEEIFPNSPSKPSLEGSLAGGKNQK